MAKPDTPIGLNEKEIVEHIHKIMDGEDWRIEMLDEIADLLTENGYVVRDPEDVEEDEREIDLDRGDPE